MLGPSGSKGAQSLSVHLKPGHCAPDFRALGAVVDMRLADAEASVFRVFKVKDCESVSLGAHVIWAGWCAVGFLCGVPQVVQPIGLGELKSHLVRGGGALKVITPGNRELPECRNRSGFAWRRKTVTVRQRTP